MADAATGDVLREIRAAPAGGCTPAVGVAFDGRDLYVTCVFTNVIDVVRPSDGALVRQVRAQGVRNPGAVSFDRGRAQLLVCEGIFSGQANSLSTARLVDPATGAGRLLFLTRGCPFALAADAADGTVYASASGSCAIDRYRSDGTLLATRDVCALGAVDPTGLVVGSTQLLVGGFGGGIYAVAKDFSSASQLTPANVSIAALACDDVTFAPRTALWALSASDRSLRAVEIPAGSCVVGGGTALPTTNEQCKNGGWRAFGFRNQGQCVSFVVTRGQKPPPGG